MPSGEKSVERPQHGAPGVVAPTTRVNVAFPFSNIHVQEPSKEVTELADLVAGLAALVEGFAPGPAVKKLHERALALAVRLH